MGDDAAQGKPIDRALGAVWHVETQPVTLVGPAGEASPKYRRRRQGIATATALDEAVDVALRLGAVFLAGGAPTDHVESAVFAAGTALGLEPFDVDITNKAITLSVQPTARRPGLTRLRVVRSRAQHHARLAAAHELVLDLTAGLMTREELLERLERLETLPRPYPRWFVTLAWGLLAGSVVIRLGGGLLVATIAFFSAAVVDRIGRLLHRYNAPGLFLNATGALIATTVAVVMTLLDIPGRSSLVVAGGIIALLPGMALVVAAQEAIGAFPVTAAARVVELSVGTVGIVAGVLGGLLIAGHVGVVMEVTEFGPATLGSTVLAVAAGGLAASASAVGSHAPARVLLSAGVAGAVATATANAVVAAGIATPGVGEAAGGVLVGLLGTWLAARHRVPAVLIVVAGIIPLLPGLATYQGLLEISQGRLLEGTEILVGAFTIALSLGAGVLLGELVLGTAARRRSAGGAPVGADTHGAATTVGVLAPSPGASPADARRAAPRPSRAAGDQEGDQGPGEPGDQGPGEPGDQGPGEPPPGAGGGPTRRPILRRGDPDILRRGDPPDGS